MVQIPLASTSKLRCVKFYLARDKISKFLSNFSLDFNFEVKHVAENGDLNNNRPSTDHVCLACVAVRLLSGKRESREGTGTEVTKT